MWGKAGQSAGPQKSAGKKSYCERDTRSGGTDPILSTQRIPRGRDLIFSTQRIPRWGDHRGAMRQKMAIFKVGNSVCRVQKHFQELSFYIFNFKFSNFEFLFLFLNFKFVHF